MTAIECNKEVRVTEIKQYRGKLMIKCIHCEKINCMINCNLTQ